MPSRAPTTWRGALLTAAAALAFGALALWWVAHLPPAWWSPLAADEPKVRELAGRVEYRLIEEAHKARPAGETWRVRITEEQINAWLAARLPAWIAHHRGLDWPEGLGSPMVRLEPAGLALGTMIGGDDGGRYLTVRLVPLLEAGGLRLEAARLWYGRLPVPGDPVAAIRERLVDAAPQRFLGDREVLRWLSVIEGGEPIEPVLELSDGRRVRLVEALLEDGSIVLGGRTISAR